MHLHIFIYLMLFHTTSRAEINKFNKGSVAFSQLFLKTYKIECEYGNTKQFESVFLNYFTKETSQKTTKTDLEFFLHKARALMVFGFGSSQEFLKWKSD